MEETHREFVKALENKIPKKTKLAEYIADVLCMEKETAYRRLRGDVQFSLREASILARSLQFSLDETLWSEKKRMVMQLPKIELASINSEFNMRSPDEYKTGIAFLESLSKENNSEFGVALSGISDSLFLKYELLTRFYMLKYIHHADSQHRYIPYEKIVISAKHRKLQYQYYQMFREIAQTYYIWDKKIIPGLVNDIKYANTIRLISDSEVNELKKELYLFINELEELAKNGQFEGTGKKFELYISEPHIDVTYAYMNNQQKWVSMLSSFIFLVTASEEKVAFENIRTWIKSLRRFSTLVSGIGERERIIFFDQQRQILNEL